MENGTLRGKKNICCAEKSNRKLLTIFFFPSFFLFFFFSFFLFFFFSFLVLFSMRIENGVVNVDHRPSYNVPCPAAPSPDVNDATSSYGSISSMIKAAAIGVIAMIF